MTSERECFVYIVPPGATEFVTAGRFRWTDDGDGTVGQFVYGRSYRERADAVELDPVELRLSSEVYETARMQGFFGAIRDSMPDFWGRRVIERNTGFTELAEFDYLLQGPDDRAGALGFGLNVEPPAPRRQFNRTLDLARLQRAADALIADDPEFAGSVGHPVEELLLLGTSMGGARPKSVVQDDHGLRIAKFSRNDDRWNHPRVEHGHPLQNRRPLRCPERCCAWTLWSWTGPRSTAGAQVHRPREYRRAPTRGDAHRCECTGDGEVTPAPVLRFNRCDRCSCRR